MKGWCALDCKHTSFGIALLVALLGLCSSAAADCPSGDSHRIESQRDGADGWWLSQYYFACLTMKIEAFESIEQKHFELLGIKDERLVAYKEQLSAESSAREAAARALAAAREEASESRPSAWEPVLWFAGGVVVTSLAVVAVGSAVK